MPPWGRPEASEQVERERRGPSRGDDVDITMRRELRNRHTIGIDNRENVEVVFVNVSLDLGRVGVVIEQVVCKVLDSL